MNIQDVIQRFIYRYTTEGAEKVTAQNQAVAASTETVSKSTLSLEKQFAGLERRFNTTLRAQQDFDKVQRQINAAVDQNPKLQERANALLALAARHYTDAAARGNAYAAVTSEINAKAMMAASSLGSFGTVLSGIGPIGLVVAAGVGAATLGISAMVKAADELADRAGKMVDFAETTGLTTTQLQALQKAAAFVGIEAEKVGTGFEKFTTTLEELRRGTGSLYDGLNRLDPQLTRQLALTKSAGEAWDVLSKAIAEATTQEQKNAIARAAFGRQGIPFTRLAGSTTEAGGLAGLEQSLGAVNTLQAEQLKRWDELKDKIDYTSKLAKQNIASIYTEEVLKAQLQFADGFLKFSQSAKEFSLSGDWSKFVADLNSSGLQKLLDNAALLSSVIPGLGALFSGAALANRLSGGGASGASGVDEAGFAGLGSVNVPMPRSRPNATATFDERFTAADLQKKISAMGDAADSADKLRLAEMQLSIASKEAALSQEQHNKALYALRSAEKLGDMRDMIHALGSAATVTELYTYRLEQLNRSLKLGRISQETYTRAVIGMQRDFDLQRERDRISALGDAATDTERYALRVEELRRQLDQGRISQETFNRALIAAHPLFQQLTGAAENFFSTFAQGIASGRSLSDSFRGSLKGLASDLTSVGTKNLGQGLKGLLSGGGLSGFDPVSLGIGAVGMALGAFMGQQEKKKQEQVSRYQAQIDAVNEANRKQTEAYEKLAEEQVRIAEETQRRIEAAGARARSYQDIIFGATTDTSTLEGQMLALEREREQAILDEQKAGNENAYLVQAAYEAKRYALLKAANDNIVEEEKRTAEERKSAMESAARTITDYLLNLRRGTDSPLSGSARLTAAQNAYGATLQLAQGGNLDALGRITQDAEAFRTASQAMFGSGSGYQSVFNQIQQQLSSLPAVTESTDPVVRALNSIASRQERAYFNDTASASTRAANLTQTQTDIMAQQRTIQEDMRTALNNIATYTARFVNTPTTPTVTPVAPTPQPYFHEDEYQNDFNRITRFNQSQSNINSWLPLPSRSDPKYTHLRFGGIVGMADGGMIANGTFDQDSVWARNSLGRSIHLAGGEFVMPAPQTKAFLPQLEAMRRGGGANDNGNVVRAIHRLTERIGVLEEQLATRIDRNTAATHSQTRDLAREERMTTRKRAVNQ